MRDDVGVGLSTPRQALDALQGEGLFEKRYGRGNSGVNGRGECRKTWKPI